MDNEKEDRLGAIMDHAARITADRADEKAAKLKDKTIKISFSAGELDRLRGKADANGLNLQNYIRKILSTYG